MSSVLSAFCIEVAKDSFLCLFSNFCFISVWALALKKGGWAERLRQKPTGLPLLAKLIFFWYARWTAFSLNILCWKWLISAFLLKVLWRVAVAWTLKSSRSLAAGETDTQEQPIKKFHSWLWIKSGPFIWLWKLFQNISCTFCVRRWIFFFRD